MVEVTVALQLAGSAYNMIKNGVERGREAQDLYEGFTRFFRKKALFINRGDVTSIQEMQK